MDSAKVEGLSLSILNNGKPVYANSENGEASSSHAKNSRT